MSTPNYAEGKKPTSAEMVPARAPDSSVLAADVSRRKFLTGMTALSGVAAGAAVLPKSLRKAVAATPADLQGSLKDIEHFVFIMQENRSFDHYFGTFPGARGFWDKHAAKLPSGRSVFYQYDPPHADGYLVPFHLDTTTTSAQATPNDESNGWVTAQEIMQGDAAFWPINYVTYEEPGVYGNWVTGQFNDGFVMGYYTKQDIPFHWALAENFTLCDAYHCSVLGPTNPNRCMFMTGTVDPNGLAGGPVLSDADGPFSWTTYPERLQAAGISWQVYQEADNGDNNALAWFTQYENAPTSSPLYQHGVSDGPADWFEQDVAAGKLPQVSWLVAPDAQSEHPSAWPAAGAEYLAAKLGALAANEDVWRKTLVIINWDEGNGIFDHVIPPTPPAGTPDEFGELYVPGPIGLGFRVPAIVISPWTVGGHIYSGLLDHTSCLRLLERRFGIKEPNISAWRRKTVGDFTGALRVHGPRAAWPGDPALTLAAAQAQYALAAQQVATLPAPVIPAVNPPFPPPFPKGF